MLRIELLRALQGDGPFDTLCDDVISSMEDLEISREELAYLAGTIGQGRLGFFLRKVRVEDVRRKLEYGAVKSFVASNTIDKYREVIETSFVRSVSHNAWSSHYCFIGCSVSGMISGFIRVGLNIYTTIGGMGARAVRRWPSAIFYIMPPADLIEDEGVRELIYGGNNYIGNTEVDRQFAILSLINNLEDRVMDLQTDKVTNEDV